MAKKPDILEESPLFWANRLLLDTTPLEVIQYCRNEANERRKHGLPLFERFWLDVERKVTAKVNGAHW